MSLIKYWKVCLFLPFIYACNGENTNTENKQKITEQAITQKGRISSAVVNKVRTEKNFNHGWLFQLTGDENASQVSYNDKTWRSLILPHDWSVEFSFTQTKADGATGYLPGGNGWYRKHFKTPDHGKKHFINFDGIYNHAEIYLNGKLLGKQVYGYTPLNYDVTEGLSPVGEDNLIAVKVDRSRYIDSRWYTGSGIYRDVKFISTNDLYIPLWGTYLTTPKITQEKADVELVVEVNNSQSSTASFIIITDIVSPSGELVTSVNQNVELAAYTQSEVKQTLSVANPLLWDTVEANLYKAHTRIEQNKKVVDEYSTTFGIRTIEYDANKGFFLNGKNMKIKGVNLHHDAGLVGTAVPDDVWRRRLLTLKEAGVNAIRAAHNPTSSSFLALCDELGLLVQAEIFDEWDNPKDKRLNQQERHDDKISRGYADSFQEHAEADLKAAVKRDRNHASVIMWSIGNEIEWTYPRYAAATGYFDMNAGGNYFFNPPFISPEEIVKRFHSSPEGKYVLAKTAKKLSKWVKELDMTRPVTANLILPSVSHITGYTDALDVIGYSYRRVIYDYGHKLFPDKMIMGNENVVQWHEWKAVMERDFIAGTFLWTGIDYLGESHNKWPVKATASGMLDVAGFDKPSYHMMKTLWNDEAHVYLTTQTLQKSPYKLNDEKEVVEKNPGSWAQRVWYWHDVNRFWQYQPEELVAIEAYTNCDAVELFHNGQSQGVQQLTDNEDRILKWVLPYTTGDITAKGLGDCQSQDSLKTAGVFAGIDINTDKKLLKANYVDVAHIDVQLLDESGNPIRFAEANISFEITGPVKLLGVDNGAHDNVQSFQATSLTTAKGRALLMVQSMGEKGEATIIAKSGDVISKPVILKIN